MRTMYTYLLIVAALAGVLFLLYGPVTSISNYLSVELRRLGNGQMLRKTVLENKGMCEKRMDLFNKYGMLIKTKSQETSAEHCDAIQNGRFVPRLWADCSVISVQ
jgi:hypothetical protein